MPTSNNDAFDNPKADPVLELVELGDPAPESIAEEEPVEQSPKAAQPAPNLDDPSLYLNRELTWLEFNRRVLNEAGDERTPLLERVKFAAIFGSNLDEFFMKRIGGLKQQLGAGVQDQTVDGRTPTEQIDECFGVIRELQESHQQIVKKLIEELKKQDIKILRYKALGTSNKKWLREHFRNNIYPLITPQTIDPAHPFPFISNLSLNLLVTLKYPQESIERLARIKVPTGSALERFIEIDGKNWLVPIEEVIEANLDMLFPGMVIEGCEYFSVTRNSNTEMNEEHAEDLLALIELELRDRKFAPIVCLGVAPGMRQDHRGFLAAELGLDSEKDVFEAGVMLRVQDLWQIAGLNRLDLKDPVHHPIDHASLTLGRSIFHTIRDRRSILLQHPYEAFGTSVERFVREAASDPKVLAIKMTLYRTSSESSIVSNLIRAAEKGKQVAVAVELKARFDEAANIRLANRMEEAGIHVTYGVVGLKTHTKVILVIRNDYDGIKRYVHVGTGNYHSGTARIYSDLGILTYDRKLGEDATELFNFLTTGLVPRRNYHKLLTSPDMLKQALIKKIRREAEYHAEGEQGHIQMKMNALEDVDICRELYKASMTGVKIDLIVRDSCRIRPGIEGVSETIKVISIVGKFLEHARLYYFRNGGKEEYLIGSADAMKRNLDHRVEAVAPVEKAELKKTLRQMIDLQLKDNRSAWDMGSDGKYTQRSGGDEGSHDLLINLAEKRKKAAKQAHKKKEKAHKSSANVKKKKKTNRNLR